MSERRRNGDSKRTINGDNIPTAVLRILVEFGPKTSKQITDTFEAWGHRDITLSGAPWSLRKGGWARETGEKIGRAAVHEATEEGRRLLQEGGQARYFASSQDEEEEGGISFSPTVRQTIELVKDIRYLDKMNGALLAMLDNWEAEPPFEDPEGRQVKSPSEVRQILRDYGNGQRMMFRELSQPVQRLLASIIDTYLRAHREKTPVAA